MKIGFFTDPHLTEAGGSSEGDFTISERLRKCMDIFGEEGIDLLLTTGDLTEVECGHAEEDLQTVKHIIDQLDIPRIIIPGNHDPFPGEFYEIFPKPEFEQTICGYRFLTFLDTTEEGEIQSERSPEVLDKLQEALSKGESGELVFTLQHYLIYPKRDEDYPFNYKNAEDIRSIQESSNKKIFSISGHYHEGYGPETVGNVTYFAGRGLKKSPHPCYIISVEDKEVKVKEKK